MAQGVQRGSVTDMPLYPGDPLTPFVGATADADRMTVEESPVIMKIPVLPLSYSDALPLLSAMTGPVAPQAWRGALPLTYHLGPEPATVRVHLEFDWNLEPAYNVIARMEGSEYPNEWIIRGNHRDGWAMGAADPASGHVALMEEARAIGVLARGGQRPKRTIVFTSWDAEEPGLIGSTEWAEHHADELREKAVAYINTDGSGRGFLNIGGSHTLERMGERGSPRRGGSADRGVGLAANTGTPRRLRQRRGHQSTRLAHQPARIGLGLHAVPSALGCGLAERRLRW